MKLGYASIISGILQSRFGHNFAHVTPCQSSLDTTNLIRRRNHPFVHEEPAAQKKMGKNQAYKAMQRSRVGSASGGPDEVEDGMMDGSFHSPEWHAARLASLKTSNTVTWEEYKKKQKEDELKKGEVEADKDRMMRDYRAQLDAERAVKLAHGRNHSGRKSSHKKDKNEKEKDSRKRSSKKRKRSRRRSSESSSSSSSSESSSSDEEDREYRRSRSRSKKTRKEKKHRSKSKHATSDEDTGPVPLSRFFGNVKS